MKTLIINLLMILCLSVSIGNNAYADDHNLTSNPFATILGFSNLEYTYKIADHLTIGIAGSTGKLKINNFRIKGYSYEALARYYFEPAFQNDSWYLVASASKRKYEASITIDGNSNTGKSEGAVVAGGFGYHWFWESFNVNLGALVSNQHKFELKDTSGKKYKDINQTIDGEFNIGWKF